MAKKVKMVKVETLPNGYSLKFDGMHFNGGYMYYTLEKLLEGFMLHIGLEITEQLNTETMQDFIVTAMNWKDNKACVKEIERLNAALKAMTGRRSALANRLMMERNRYNALIDDMKCFQRVLKEHPDGNLAKEFRKLTNGYKTQPRLTLETLGVDSEDLTEDETEDDDS